MGSALQLKLREGASRQQLESWRPAARSAWSYLTADCLRDLTASRHPFSAFEDSLTGLANRSAALAIVDGLIARNQHFGLILVDLDGFKNVNDTLGHDAGDELLQKVATSLTARPDWTLVARLGGDEFAVILPDLLSKQCLGRAASEICNAIKAYLQNELTGTVHASAGAAHFPSHATNRSDLLKRADIALYEAKRTGRDRAALFKRSMQRRVERKSLMLATAQECVSQSERMSVYFQPKVEIQTGAVTGFEALLRCRDRTGRMRSPAWLADALGDSSIAVRLGDFVIGGALDFLAEASAQNGNFGHLAINVTAFELRSPGWIADFTSRLRDHDIRPSAIEVEINESVVIGDSAGTILRAMRSLHELGVRISLDDFGTGFASLAHLRTCPVDALKIDQSFIRTISDPESQAIVRAMIELARALNLGIVAEGIESLAQHELLRSWGCLEGQGYFYGRPAPAERWLKQRSSGAKKNAEMFPLCQRQLP